MRPLGPLTVFIVYIFLERTQISVMKRLFLISMRRMWTECTECTECGSTGLTQRKKTNVWMFTNIHTSRRYTNWNVYLENAFTTFTGFADNGRWCWMYCIFVCEVNARVEHGWRGWKIPFWFISHWPNVSESSEIVSIVCSEKYSIFFRSVWNCVHISGHFSYF